jgi:hypothetical protein
MPSRRDFVQLFHYVPDAADFSSRLARRGGVRRLREQFRWVFGLFDDEFGDRRQSRGFAGLSRWRFFVEVARRPPAESLAGRRTTSSGRSRSVRLPPVQSTWCVLAAVWLLFAVVRATLRSPRLVGSFAGRGRQCRCSTWRSSPRWSGPDPLPLCRAGRHLHRAALRSDDGRVRVSGRAVVPCSCT